MDGSRSRVIVRAALALFVIALIGATPAHAQRRAVAGWWDRTTTRSSEHYLVRTDLPTADARRWARHLDTMYDAYARRLASLPPRVPEELHVYVFSRRAEYVKTLRERFAIDATGTGGMFFINPNGSGLAFWTEGLPRRRIEHVIQHEGFHQFAWSRFGPDLPIWLNEGLAEFFGASVMLNGRLVLGESTPHMVETVRAAVKDDTHVPFGTMLTMSNATWNDRVRTGTMSGQYQQAWSMVHFLVYGDGGKYQEPFERFLRMINRGTTAERAFAEVFGTDLAAFEARWKVHAERARPGAFVTALQRAEFLAAGALALSRAGRTPGTLDELKAALREIDFEHVIAGHGHAEVLRAADDRQFEIPPASEEAEPPVFVVEKKVKRRMSRRERLMEEEQPTPAEIRTEGLRPREIAVRWVRDRKTGALRFEIE